MYSMTIPEGDTIVPFIHNNKSERKWWFDGSRFWTPDEKGNWITLDKSSFQTYLLKNPFTTFRGFKEEGEAISPAEVECLDTMINSRVAYAGPLSGWKRGIQHFDDTLALITKSPKLIEPAEGDFSTILSFLSGLLGHEEQQLDHVLYWIKDTLDALYEGRPRLGLALVLAGEAGCGKTLLKEILRELFGGREVYPYAYMMGKDNFNEELTQAPMWVVDDEAADTTLQGRIRFGAEIKKVVANSAMRCRGMHQTAVTLNPLRRLVICVNVEPDRLLVLPPIDDDIADKILITKCVQPCPWPMPMTTHEEKVAFFDKVRDEFPALIHHLRHHVDEIPRDFRGRFGVKHYHNPEICDSLMEISPEMQLAEQIERVLFGRTGIPITEWKGSTNELIRIMHSDDSPLASYEKAKIPAAAWIGRRLGKLSARFPGRYELKKTENKNVWTIKPMDGAQ